MEKETTGLYLSGHPMDAYRAAARRIGAVPIVRIHEDFAREEGPQQFQDGQRVTIAGVITASKTKTTKNNTLMAYVTVEDDTSSIELLCFSRTLQTCGAYLQANQSVVVRGKLSVRDEKAVQLLCDSAGPLSEDPNAVALPGKGADRRPPVAGEMVYLRLKSELGRDFRYLQLLLQMFPGQTPVKIRLTDSGRLLGAACLLHASLVRELKEVYGEENVVIK